MLLLKIDRIPGDSTVPGHENEIALTSFSWGVSNPNDIQAGQGQKSVPMDLTVEKTFDIASPRLALACASGMRFASATLYAFMTGDGGSDVGQPTTPYLTITLSNVLVSSYETKGDEDARPSEKVTFSFGKIEMAFRQYIGGGNYGDPVKMSWDFVKNRPT